MIVHGLNTASAESSSVDLSLIDILRKLRQGSLSSGSLAEAAIARHEQYGQLLNAYRSFSPEVARSRAREADRAFAANKDLGPLQGIPISIKDMFGVSGFPIYAGSPKQLPPRWERSGPVVNRIQSQLGVVVGKSHTVEFALGGLGTNSHYGSPRNPWDARDPRISGGSSSGAGVSLLEGSALVALGSDTSGSVRMPASMTGTVGLMVSHGRWSTAGVVPVAPILDAPGLLTRSVADLVPAFFALDRHDPSFWKDHVATIETRSLSATRLGVPRKLFWDDCSPGVAESVEAALTELERHGVERVEIELPEPIRVFEMFQEGHLSTAAVYSLIRNEFPEWWETLDSNVRDRLERYGAMLPAHEYVRRMRQIDTWMREADSILSGIDALAVPTVSSTPARLSDLVAPETSRDHNLAASRNSAIVALLGLVALSIPVGLDAAGMPVGLQLAARHGQDTELIGLAYACERVLGTAAQRIGTAPLIRPPSSVRSL